MKKLFSNLAFGIFCLGLIYVFGLRVVDWYQTGRLAMHRKMIHGLDFVSYDSDAVMFAWLLAWNVFFFAMGFLGLGVLLKQIREERE